MMSTGGIVNTVNGNFDTSKGEIRLAQVYIDKKYFPDFTKVTGLLQHLIKYVNHRIDDVSELEALKLAADFHYNLVNIHPYGDGNRRTARLFMNYIQMYHSEPLVKVFTEDRAAYIDALNSTEELDDITIFRNFICEQQINFYETELEKFKKRNKGSTLLF